MKNIIFIISLLISLNSFGQHLYYPIDDRKIVMLDSVELKQKGITYNHLNMYAADSTEMEIINLIIPSSSFPPIQHDNFIYYDILVSFAIYPNLKETPKISWQEPKPLKTFTLDRFLDSVYTQLSSISEYHSSMISSRLTNFIPCIQHKCPNTPFILTEMFIISGKFQYFPVESDHYSLNLLSRPFDSLSVSKELAEGVEYFKKRFGDTPSNQNYPIRFPILLAKKEEDKFYFFRYKSGFIGVSDIDRFWLTVQNGGIGFNFVFDTNIGIIACGDIPFFNEYYKKGLFFNIKNIHK